MREMKRAVHIDFHTMPGIDDFGKHIDAKEIAETLHRSNVRYVNFFGRCNKGFSYYPTKIGIQYPGLTSNLLKNVIDECHKYDIGVTAYLNGCFSHEIILRHPEFAKMGKDGTRFVYTPEEDMHAYQQGCFNTTFKEHILQEIREMLEYNPDGIFVDCIVPYKCYCPACVNKMKERNMDPTDDTQVFNFAVDTLYEMLAAIREVVPPDKRLFYNSLPYDAIHQFLTHAEVECLTTGGWGYDYFTPQATYFRDIAKDRVYMNGCFVESWGDFGGKKDKAALESDVYDALLYGYAPSIGDHMHPRDGLSKKLYNDIKEIYEYVEKLEPWIDETEPYAEVAILRNKLTYKNVNTFLTDPDKGMVRMLAELKICFNVINEDMDFSKYKLLILPNGIDITDKLNDKLKSFAGGVISCGNSIRQGSIWNYIDEFETDNNTHGFYSDNGEIYGMYETSIKMKSKFSVVDYIEPYYNEGFDGRHYYFYVPPKGSIGYCAVAKMDNKAHICFDISGAYIKHTSVFHKKLLNDLIEELMPKRILSTNLPSTSRVTLAKGNDFDVMHIKVTFPEIRGTRGGIEEHVEMPAGKTVTVLGEYRSVKLLPEEINVEFMSINGKTEITLPKICGYAMFELKK